MPRRSSPNKSVFSRRLLQARQLRGLPQDRLGVLAGLEESSSSARMSRYESGVHEPPYQFVEAIAHVLGIQPAFFYCSDDRLADIILIYGALPEDERQALHRSAVERSAD